MSRGAATWLCAALLVGCGADARTNDSLSDASAANGDASLSIADGSPPLGDGAPTPRGLLVGYYADWAATTFPVASIDWTPLTHVAEAFALPQPDGGGLTNGSAIANDALVAAAHAHGVKVVISVGGAHGVFDGAATTASSRAATVAAVAALCKNHGYDGVDIDWEFPDATTVPSWVLLVSELRAALDAVRPGLSVSSTLGPWPPSSDILPAATLATLSWVSVMTYRYASASSGTVGYFAPLDGDAGPDDPRASVADSIRHLVGDRGLPPSKLLLGLGFYGLEFTDGPPGTTIGSASNVTVLSQGSIAPLLTTGGWVYAWNATASEPSLSHGKTFVTYENGASIDAKCAFVHAQGLGGAMIWHLGDGLLADGTQPLLVHTAGCR